MKRIVDLVIFVLSISALIISLKLFWNMGIYVDEYNTSPSIVCGGDFWLYMDWLRLALLSIISIISGVRLFYRSGL